MDTISDTDILSLVHAQGDRFVSLYLPTYPVGEEQRQNPIRFKNLLTEAEATLTEQGMTPGDCREFLAPARNLLDQPLFWQSLRQGLAVLVGCDGIHVWRLPVACEQLSVAGKRFHVTPLLPWLADDAPYYVLALSQSKVRLLQGTRYELRDVEVPDLPVNLTDALHYDQRDACFQLHSGQPQLRGKEGFVFYGQGGAVDVAKTELLAFFRLIDAALCRTLRNRMEPLVFAGVDYLGPIYRESNHYPHLLDAHLAGNPDLLPATEIRERAWSIVAASLHERQESALAKYWRLVTHGQTFNRVDDIVAAAQAGAVETLFIDPAIRKFGTFHPKTGDVQVHERSRHDREDLVNLATMLVLRNGGTVVPLTAQHIPGGGVMAAVLRYAFARSVADANVVSNT